MDAAGCVAARQQAVSACGAAAIGNRSRRRRLWRRRVGGGGVTHSMCTCKAENLRGFAHAPTLLCIHEGAYLSSVVPTSIVCFEGQGEHVNFNLKFKFEI